MKSVHFSLLTFIGIFCAMSMTMVMMMSSRVVEASTVFPDGLYCGGNKNKTITSLFQLHGNIASILFTLPSSSSSSSTSTTTPRCEVQFVVSNLAMNNQQGQLAWALYNTNSGSATTDYCQGLQVASSIGYTLNSADNSVVSLSVGFTYKQQPADALILQGQAFCKESLGIVASPWLPSGPYCTNLTSTIGITFGVNNKFEIDLLGLALNGRVVINATTGAMNVFVLGQDMTSLLTVAQYDSTSGIVHLQGSFDTYTFDVVGSQAFCYRPAPAQQNANMVPSGSYCGASSSSYVALTLAEGHLFSLNFGGICTAQGIFTETVSPSTPPVINFFFDADYDCLENVSVVSALGAKSSSSSSSSSGWDQINITLSGGDNQPKQTLMLQNNTCSAVPGLPQLDVVPNGFYCVSPAIISAASTNVANLPAGTLGVAIFGTFDPATNSKQRYQLWSGACEAHGKLTIDSLTGAITLYESYQTQACPATAQEMIAGISYSYFSHELRIDIAYQGLVVRVVATQQYCPANTPSSIITSLPTGMYCVAPATPTSVQSLYPFITVLGTSIDFTFSGSCTAHGMYSYNSNGVVNVSVTSVDSCPGGMFLHSVAFVPSTPVVPASFSVRGLVNNQSVSFTAKNCSTSSSSSQNPAANLCFNVADASQVLHMGYLLLTKTEARFTLGPCIVSATYTTTAENLVQNFAVTFTTPECSGVSMKVVSFSSADGTNTAALQISTSSTSQQQQVTASASICPVIQTSSTTTVAPTPPPTPSTSTTSATQAPTSSSSSSSSSSSPQSTSSSPSTSSPPMISSTTTATSKVGTTAAPSQQQQSTTTTTATSSSTIAPTTQVQAPTTSTLAPTIPLGVYTFTTGSTSNSLAGTLTVSSTAVVLEVGSCTKDGNLVQQTTNTNNYDFVASTQNNGCATTTISSVTVATTSSSSSSSSNQITVAGTVNGASFSAAAQEQSSNTAPPPPAASNSAGIIAGAVIGGIALVGLVAFLYIRKRKSSTGSGNQSTSTQQFSDFRQVNQNVNEEMLSSTVSQYQNYDERLSTQGQNDAGFDI